MNSYRVTEIKPNSYYKAELTLDNLFVIAIPPCPITQPQLKALKDWNFEELFSEGTINIGQSAQAQVAAGVHVEMDATEDVSISDFEGSESGEQNNAAKGTQTQQIQQKEPLAESDNINKRISKAATEDEKMQMVQSAYDEYMKYITGIYTHYATHRELNIEEISGTVLELCNFVRENQRYVLRISPTMEARNKLYLISHSMRCTVYSIIIGLQLHMPIEKLVELGVTSVLHEIGQIRLPPQLYMSNKTLTHSERAQMNTHPILSYNILKEAKFPLSVQLGALEHHERETGTGYPRHLTGDKISLYAKIIAVACSFEAITAPREFRDAKTSYEAMIEMLKNEKHQYDDTVVRALLFSLSLYPIGAYVYLSNGKVAQVTDVNPNDPKNPIVQIVGERNPQGNPIMLQTDDKMLKIVRPMTKAEADDVLKVLKKMNSSN